MWVLLGFSVIGLGVALERVFMLRRGTTAPRGLIRKAGELWRQGKYDEVYALANQSRSTMGRIIAFLAEKRGASIEEVNIGASDIASSEHRRLMSRFSLLSVITMASPLTGLLGTVGAMIEAFRNVVNAGKLGSAAVLYASISTALVTTEAGLMVAIPALILYHYFKNRTNAYSAIVDEEATVLINEWFIGKGKGPSA
jgi:biopolymer transport protein ExbB